MPIALALPFAEAAGIAVAGLSAAAIANKVSEYIKLNPEDSMTILKMINPASAGEGLSTLFKKKAKTEKEKEPSIEDLEEIGEDLSQSDKAKVMKAYGKSKGADKRQRMIDIAKKLGLAGEGKERQKSFDEVEGRYEDSDFEEERTKPKFDYTKFFKANGGRIGYQEGGGITNIINSDLRSPEEAFTQPLSTAVKAYGNYYGIGQPITSFDQFTQAEQNVIMDSIRQTVNNPNLYSYTATNIPMNDYQNTFNPSDLPEASKRGISGSGYNSFLDQLKDMSAAIKGDPAANVRMTLGRFNTNINPTNISGGITDKYNFAQGTLGWTGATPYDINFSLPQSFVQEIVNNPNYQATTKYDDQGRKLVSESMVNNIFNNEAYNGEQLKAAFGDNVSFVSDDYYNSAPNFNADVLREEEDAQYNLPQKNIFQSAGNFIGKLNLEDYLPFIGQKSLTGMMGRGIGNLFQNIAPARYGTSQRAYNALTPQGRLTVGSIYGPGGIMSGYNAVSAFGRGPLESITNRISKTRNPVIKEQLITAGKNITDYGQDTSKTGYNAVTQKGTYGYDDVNVGGSGTGGSGSKIVCTMMNESYGFGNFRNKIWLKHSKDLPKEYEIGYHAIFLPLVKFAKKKGKLNKLVKKTLEHVAKHRTIDLKQEMKGKKHLLGRIYRKVLEPICYLVGKIKNG